MACKSSSTTLLSSTLPLPQGPLQTTRPASWTWLTNSPTFATTVSSQSTTNAFDSALEDGIVSTCDAATAVETLEWNLGLTERYGLIANSKPSVRTVPIIMDSLRVWYPLTASPASSNTCTSSAWPSPGFWLCCGQAEPCLTHLVSVLAPAVVAAASDGSVDDPNLSTFDSNEGHRLASTGLSEPPKLALENRSKSFGGESMGAKQAQQSSYAETVGEMKRLRSTRLDKSLSTSFKTTRTSRIIDGPEAQDLASNVDAADRDRWKSNLRVIEDRDLNGDARTELTFGKQNGVTLDDLPRILAAEQAKEQRPNAYKHSHNKLVGGKPHARLLSTGYHQTTTSDDMTNAPQNFPVERTKKYFSELSGLEYFIVRHVAVLQMQPLLEGHFNLEDLLSLIELKKQTFWTKLFNKNAGKGDRPAKPSKKKGVFGVSLEVLVEKDGVESTYGVGPGALRIPTLLDDAITAMRQMDMSVEGVFRKNGNIRRLKDLADKIDAKEDVDLNKENAVQVAALLKRFLREMPDPLMTHKLHSLFTTSQSKSHLDRSRSLPRSAALWHLLTLFFI